MRRPCLTCGRAYPSESLSRGRCPAHRLTEEQRGYGPQWRRVRTAVRREERGCQVCGTTLDLTVDHIVPQSLGGTNERSNLRVLCRVHHAQFGVKRTSSAGRAGQISGRSRRSDTCAPFREKNSEIRRAS